MIIRGLIFDINGTLIDIHTNEGHDEIYRILSHLLTYQGITLHRNEIRDLFFQIMKDQRRSSKEEHPEFDAVAIFREIISRYANNFTHTLTAEKLKQLPLIMAEVYRAASRFKLQLYPGVKETLDLLRMKYRLAIVSDGQTAWAVPELNAVGLLNYFKPVIVSGDFGYRKPDTRLFETALKEMNMQPSEVLYIGNDMRRDVFGAQQLGVKTVFFKSNQGEQEKEGINPEYIIYNFPELLNAVSFFETR
ncbi:MAG: HAD family hydrolase [bacterium]